MSQHPLRKARTLRHTSHRETLGGKASGLLDLAGAGCRVPAWEVLDASYFRLDSGEGPLSRDVMGELERIVGSLGPGPLAVRSSATVEDGDERSFAGAFTTVLGVHVDPAAIPGTGTGTGMGTGMGLTELADAVRTCWRSAAGANATVAGGKGRGTHTNPVGPVVDEDPTGATPAMAVVIQRMISPRAAGVVFTGQAYGRPDTLLVSAVPGLGEGLVSGAVDADVTLVDLSGRRLREHLGDKETMFRQVRGTSDRAGGDARIEQVEIPMRDRAGAVLTDGDLRALAAEVAKLPDPAGSGIDVEYAIDDDGVWMLQSRPVTAVIPEPDLPVIPDAADVVRAESTVPGQERIWDNSNILESFNGPTSPLTFSTASSVYARVYDGYARSLRVPRAQLAQVREWTPELLGQFHGRVYYNLMNWYRMVGIAPGYPLNRRVLEVALGVSESLDTATARTLHPFRFATPLHRLVSRTITTAIFVRRLLGIEEFVDDFLSSFDTIYREYDGIDYDALSGPEVFRRYEEMERRLIDRWGPVMVLDAALLTLSGSMFGATKLLLPDAPEWVGYAVISPGADIESAEPAHALSELAGKISADPDPDLRAMVVEGSGETALARIREEGPDWLRADIDAYLADYGYRSPDELKLEIPDLREDPSLLIGMIRGALSSAAPDHGPEAEDYLDAHLTGLRRRFYDGLRHRVARAAACRERVRFARTRAFGMIKRMVRAMGRDLASRGVIDAFDDVFWLRLDEIRSLYRDGAPTTEEVRRRIASRRRAREIADGLVAPARFRTAGGRPSPSELSDAGFVPLTQIPSAERGDVLGGIASSSGTARGVVVVVSDPADATGGIIATYRTDPGWVTALPSATALLIERGSPLTHVAIIAREMGIPTVVQIDGLTTALRTGMEVEVDATGGTVTILSTEGVGA